MGQKPDHLGADGRNWRSFCKAWVCTTAAAGRVIFTAGDPSDRAFVVVEGEVELTLGDSVLTTVGPGGLIGEMSLIEQTHRSATATTKTDVKVVPITQKRFMYLVQETPYFAITVMKIMAERLRTMNARV
ncbi:MAG: cyclic nucleotide-binding domain-containing protein [Gloeomargaritaceae cyanobacterium C42_A2020_066]|nr:cyclic nucleotide-binding domain-containing protein [Gloeomargaritaceae cyanobacterium C42_A2020_066]